MTGYTPVTLFAVFAYSYMAACMSQGNVVEYHCLLSKDW